MPTQNKTPIFNITKRIVDNVDRQISDNLIKWRMFSAKWKLEVDNFYGKPIRYEGVMFEGTPRDVFWGNYIEPFLENGIHESFKQLEIVCKEKNIGIEDYIYEMRGQLEILINKTYNYMAEIDQVLRGGGFPNSIQKVNVSGEIEAMVKYLDECIVGVLHKDTRIKLNEEVLELKPNIYGIGINLKALWRKIIKLFSGT
jgi:hypothetical protein